MRLITSLLGMSLVMAACTSSTVTPTTSELLVPPSSPGPPPSTTVTTDRPPPPTRPPGGGFISPITGSLPDGIDYVVYLQTHEPEELVGIIAWVMYEAGDAVWAAPVTFQQGPFVTEPTFAEGVYVVSAGGWVASVEFSPEFLMALGPDAEYIIKSGISGVVQRWGFPGLILKPPFRWATQYDPTGPIEVRYQTIAVRPGCGEEALACSQTHAVEVLALPGYTASGVYIDSDSARPISDPSYLDPGPLSPRRDPDLIWTGEEMVVWGGRTDESNRLIDGAAFNPDTNTWRILAESPLPAGTQSRAVWADGEMVLVSVEGTLE